MNYSNASVRSTVSSKFEFWVEEMKMIQTKGEGLGLLFWVWVADHELANSSELNFKRFNRVWTWIIRDDLSPRWDQEKSKSDRSVHVSKVRSLWETVPVRSVWNFVRRVGQRFTGGLWIWTSGQNQLQSNFNLSDYLFIKIPKMNVKDTVQENNSKIEKNELTFMILKWLIQIIQTRRKLDFQIFEFFRNWGITFYFQSQSI